MEDYKGLEMRWNYDSRGICTKRRSQAHIMKLWKSSSKKYWLVVSSLGVEILLIYHPHVFSFFRETSGTVGQYLLVMTLNINIYQCFCQIPECRFNHNAWKSTNTRFKQFAIQLPPLPAGEGALLSKEVKDAHGKIWINAIKLNESQSGCCLSLTWPLRDNFKTNMTVFVDYFF